MKNTKLQIENRKGYKLHAYLELPANQKPNFYGIFAHCFTCSSSLKAVRNISRSLTNFGFGVVRFDFIGLRKNLFANTEITKNMSKDVFINIIFTGNIT